MSSYGQCRSPGWAHWLYTIYNLLLVINSDHTQNNFNAAVPGGSRQTDCCSNNYVTTFHLASRLSMTRSHALLMGITRLCRLLNACRWVTQTGKIGSFHCQIVQSYMGVKIGRLPRKSGGLTALCFVTGKCKVPLYIYTLLQVFFWVLNDVTHYTITNVQDNAEMLKICTIWNSLSAPATWCWTYLLLLDT